MNDIEEVISINTSPEFNFSNIWTALYMFHHFTQDKPALVFLSDDSIPEEFQLRRFCFVTGEGRDNAQNKDVIVVGIQITIHGEDVDYANVIQHKGEPDGPIAVYFKTDERMDEKLVKDLLIMVEGVMASHPDVKKPTFN